MSGRDAFLAAISAAPDDDAPKLIYADWLEEHGNEAEARQWRQAVACNRLGCDLHGVWIIVHSTWIDKARFDHDCEDYGTMTIKFKNGKMYSYHDIHPGYWCDFLSSTSKSLFVWQFTHKLSKDVLDEALDVGLASRTHEVSQ